MLKLKLKKNEVEDFDTMAAIKEVMNNTGLDFFEVLGKMIKYAYSNIQYIK